MASFQAKIGWKRLTKRGNKNYNSISFLPKSVIENSKKIAKKFRKLKKTIKASFEAKIGWRRSRKRENNNYRTVPYQLDA